MLCLLWSLQVLLRHDRICGTDVVLCDRRFRYMHLVATYGGWKDQTPERTDRCREITVVSTAEAALN